MTLSWINDLEFKLKSPLECGEQLWEAVKDYTHAVQLLENAVLALYREHHVDVLPEGSSVFLGVGYSDEYAAQGKVYVVYQPSKVNCYRLAEIDIRAMTYALVQQTLLRQELEHSHHDCPPKLWAHTRDVMNFLGLRKVRKRDKSRNQ